jgi:hypothetical protein
MYQAYKLHYERKLAVYPRPEPKYVGAEKEWNPPESEVVSLNPDQIGLEQDAHGGQGIGAGIGWQEESGGERSARRIISAWCAQRAEETGTSLEIEFHDRRTTLRFPSSGEVERIKAYDSDTGKTADEGKETLVIQTADPKFFTDLLVSPTPTHWLVLAPELLTSVSSSHVFTEFFSATSLASGTGSTDTSMSAVDRWIYNRQRQYLFFLYTDCLIAPAPHLVNYSLQHFTKRLSLASKLRVYMLIWLHTFTEMLEERIMSALGAKFVEGREPWKIYERALRRLDREQIEDTGKVAEQDLGSVLLS